MSKGLLRPGDDLLAVGYAGLKGTSVLTSLFSDKLSGFFPDSFLNRIRAWDSEAPVDPERIERILDSCSAWTEVSRGGILASLWKISEDSGTGLEADACLIPIRQETVEICEFFDLNPYRLLCRNVWIAGTAGSWRILRDIKKLGLPCAVIGTVTTGPARMLKGTAGWRYLERPMPDELEHESGNLSP